MKSILDKSFRYTPAASTNLRLTFARIRRELKQQAEAEAAAKAEAQDKVRQMNRSKS